MASSIGKAIAEGASRATSARALIAGLWLVNLLVAGAMAIPLGDSLRSSIGPSLVHEKLRASFDMGWFGELAGTARGLETTFTPALIGAGAFYSNLEGWLNGRLFTAVPSLVSLGIAYLALWVLLLGGILERMARRERRPTLADFLSSAGRHFFRFAQLTLMSGVLYVLVYLFGRWLFLTIEDATRDVTVERVVLLFTVVGAALLVFLLCLINAAFDYAKIATMLEGGGKSMVRMALRGFRFVLAEPRKTMGLYFALGLVGLALLAVYSLVAPGARQATVPGIVLAFLVGQIYLVVKLVIRLTFYASQMALYEGLAPGGAGSNDGDAARR
jgi:hypothetical protein